MKHLKKVLALVVAMMMVVAMAVPSMAAVGALTVNGDLEIDGLDKGDVVTYYQILKWDPDNSIGETDETGAFPIGWVWNTDQIDLSKIGDEAAQKAAIRAIVGTADQAGKISAELAGKIAAGAKSGTATAALTGTTWEQTVENAGLYLAIVTPKTPGTLYNPIFVAANWVGDNETADTNNTKVVKKNTLDYDPAAMAKKTTLTLDKTATGQDESAIQGNDIAGGAYTTEPGEEIDFTVKTHVPKFATNYTTPVFALTDTLEGLALTGDNVKVYTATNGEKDNPAVELVKGKDYTITGSAADSTTYTITFTSDYLWDSGAEGVTDIPDIGQDIVVEYTAKVTDAAEQIVNQDTNTVDLKYSTNPSDTTGKGLLRDQTNHYTFSIDAGLLGHDEISGSSNDAIKVGVDKEGNNIVKESSYAWSEDTVHAPLEGATFRLYTAQADADAANDNYLKEVVTDGAGRLTITGLDAGEYYLKEITAPTGYIKKQETVKVTITAVITESRDVVEEVDNDGTPVEVTYITNALESYKVTFGEGGESSYTITLSESSAKAISAERETSSSDQELANTKGVELPSTGGMGTTIFYIVGAVLVLGAGIVLVTRRRMSAN